VLEEPLQVVALILAFAGSIISLIAGEQNGAAQVVALALASAACCLSVAAFVRVVVRRRRRSRGPPS
jgi:hypothetical protein